jgi:hypothetical protein
MKKVMLFIALYSLTASLHAQITIPKTDPTSVVSSFVKPPAIGDIGKTTSGIMGMLGGLGMSDAQKPKISDLIGGFLGQKQGILGLASKDPAGYLAKFNPLQQGLFGKMKGIMGATMFSKFLGMKPSGKNIGTNLLSNLFF